MIAMKLYIKNKKDFTRVDDYADVKVGKIVKVYSERSEKFINTVPYFVIGILGDNIALESSAKRLNFNIRSETLSLQ